MDLQENINPYFERYLDHVPPGSNVLDLLRDQREEVLRLFRQTPADRWTYAYAPGKWTLLQSWLHVIDSERIFAARALRIARGDQTPQPGFDQNEYAALSNHQHRTAADLAEEYQIVRQSTILLFRHLTPAGRNRVGTFSGHDYRAATVARILLGHERHHIALTKNNYLV